MFLKQYNYKPRSNSQSSASGQSSSPTSAQSDNSATAAAAAATSPTSAQSRRRSSASEKFAGLNSHKRNSVDEVSAAKKANWADQKPGQPGVLGQMWSNFTKGS